MSCTLGPVELHYNVKLISVQDYLKKSRLIIIRFKMTVHFWKAIHVTYSKFNFHETSIQFTTKINELKWICNPEASELLFLVLLFYFTSF